MYIKISRNVIQNLPYLSEFVNETGFNAELINNVGTTISVMTYGMATIDEGTLSIELPKYQNQKRNTIIKPFQVVGKYRSILHKIVDCFESYHQYSFAVHKLVCNNEKYFDDNDVSLLENISFINENHSHIKVAMLYMNKHYWIEAKNHLDKVIEMVLNRVLKINSLPTNFSILGDGAKKSFPKIEETIRQIKIAESKWFSSSFTWSNEEIRQLWCENRDYLLRANTLQMIPILSAENRILQDFILYETLTKVHTGGNVFFDSLPLSVFLKIICYMKADRPKLARHCLKTLKVVISIIMMAHNYRASSYNLLATAHI